jgi:hypothetical protein
MGRGLAEFAQSFVAAVASTVSTAMFNRGSMALSAAPGIMSGAFGNAMQTTRNIQGAEFLRSTRTGLMGSLQGTFGGMMGMGGTATAAAQGQVLEWMQDAFGSGGPMWDQAKRAIAPQFDFVTDLAGNVADSFAEGFGDGLVKAFGRNPLGRALARTMDRWLSSVLEDALAGLFPQSGQAGAGGKQKFGGLIGGLIGSAFGGGLGGGIGAALGNMLGFADGGWVPGPPGAPRPAIVHGGEYVMSRAQVASGPSTMVVNLGGVTIADDYDVDRMIDQISWRTKTRKVVNPR